MGENGHLIRRGRTYHFRRVVPEGLRPLIGRRELLRSLRTTRPRTARLRAAQLYVASERLFTALSTPGMLTPDDLSRLVQDFYATVLEEENRVRLASGVLTPEICERRQAYYDLVARNTRDALRCNRLDEARLVTISLLNKRRVPLETLQPADFAQAKQAVLRAGIDVAEALKARYEGDFNHEPADALLKVRLADLSPVVEAQAARARPEIVEPAAPAATGPRMSAVGPDFRKRQVATKTWDEQTASQAGATYRLFIDVCGDKSLGAYSRKDAGAFRAQIERLPTDYGKSPVFRNLTVQAIIDAHAALPPDRQKAIITQRTVQRHFSVLSALWVQALPRGEVGENIFSGFRFAAAKQAIDQRAMWTPEELASLFATPIWTGYRSEGRRSTPGSLIRRDEHFWLPLIAVFSGLRQEEICQLHNEDIRAADGIFYFDINSRPPRKLKNRTAVRKVPIHPELIRLGFLTHVDDARRAGAIRVFPAFEPGGADGRLGHAYSKGFTRYREAVGLRRTGLDFHSFRHTATTLMHQAGVERSVIDHVTGHASGGETARYTKGSTVRQMSDAIGRIDIGADLSKLHATTHASVVEA